MRKIKPGEMSSEKRTFYSSIELKFMFQDRKERDRV